MLNFAIVGCGRISKRHVELLGGNKIQGARLVSLVISLWKKLKLLHLSMA